MIEKPYYYGTIKRLTTAFGSIFNKIHIERVDGNNETIDVIKVPLMYMDKERFVIRATQSNGIDGDVKVKETLPAIGFEMQGIEYDAMRKTNTLNRMTLKHSADSKEYMFNRVPYNIRFAVYIAVRRIDDGLRIVEQILPYFTPELGMRIQDIEGAENIVSDIPVTLDSVDYVGDTEGSFSERRTILWSLNFTMRAHLYTNREVSNVIKTYTVDLSDPTSNIDFESLTNEN